MPIFTKLSDLASSIGSADYVALGGFQLNRVPMALVQEVADTGPRELRVVSAPNPLALDVLCATVVTGLASALPMLAIELARRTHAPNLRYINCVGAVNPRLDKALPTSVDASLLQACESTISLPELFDLALANGVDLMFFGAGQIDKRGRVNLTCIGSPENPSRKLPGPAGSRWMRAAARRVVITVARQSTRNLVAAVDVATSEPSPANAETTLITDLAVWRLHRELGLEPMSLHPGISPSALRQATGFSYRDSSSPATALPSSTELDVLRTLDPSGMRHRWAGTRPLSRAIEAQPEKQIHGR